MVVEAGCIEGELIGLHWDLPRHYSQAVDEKSGDCSKDVTSAKCKYLSIRGE